ncbi:glycosyltransferase [Cryptosporangium japonicum]|uniref:NodB homology domain-containing protein n=1 Tax=Cryptosporangium japonicum TaxID=80872 RepID=A0ABN0TE53_9ACTN
MLEFSVVIPTFNRRDLLVDTLTALGETERPWPCELIVVVDGSTDGSTEAARALSLPLPLRVIEQPNSGAASARNRGAEAARGRYLLFLDDDMIADGRLLVEHAAVLAGGADAVVGTIPIHPDAPASLLREGVERWARLRHERLSRTGGQLTLPDLITGQLSVRAEAFRRISGFDTEFTAGGTFGAEDTDFLYRLLNEGLVARYAPGAVSHQRYVVTPEHNLRQWRQAGRADAALTRKHSGLAPMVARAHGSRTVKGAVLRRTAGRLPGALERAATRAVLARASAARTDLATQWAFTLLRDAQYWQGVREGGGMTDAPGSPRVLAYHAVDDVTDPRLRQYSVTPDQFEQQLDALGSAGFAFIGPQDLLRKLDGEPVPERSVLVSFDDGYVSNYDHAAPVLEKHGIPAILFAVTGELGRWNAWDTASGATRLPLMTARQLTELTDLGWEIGTHTRAHAHLSLLRPAALAGELVRPRDDLASLGLPRPRLLAYPYGEHNLRVRRAAARAGYAAAFALSGARTTMDRGNRYAIPRIEVTRDLSPEALVRLALDPPRRRWQDVRREVRGLGRAAATSVLPERRSRRAC